MVREILYYENKNGKCPVWEYLNSLNAKETKKITFVFNLIEEMERVPGNFLKKLNGSEDIWEIRVNINKKFFRFFCFFHKGNLVIVTNGYAKKTNKTDKKEIEIAEKYRKDFLNREVKR